MKLRPEDVSLLERFQSVTYRLGPEDVSLLERCPCHALSNMTHF